MTNLTDLFCSFTRLPSPSMQEERVALEILDFFKKNNIQARQDDFGNIYAYVTPTDPSKPPLMLSAHMDVVGDNSPVNIVSQGDILKTDGKRTLGADDKAGVAVAMMLAKELTEDKTAKHGGLEIVFTKDEEQNMSGAHALKFNQFKSEYILVLDADRLGDFQIAGAGYTKMLLHVQGFKGGHSGIDIDDTQRVNAVKLIAEIMSVIPQGVYHKDETGVITSINAGAVVGGGVKNTPTDKQGTDFELFLTDTAMSNIINTDAFALYSIRSSDKANEAALIAEIQKEIDAFNSKYKERASFNAKFEQHIPPFEKSNDTVMIETARIAAQKSGISLNVSSFHAGAETHIYAQKQNADGKTFKPYLVGTANIYNMHSAKEYVEKTSMIKGYDFIKTLFYTFNGL